MCQAVLGAAGKLGCSQGAAQPQGLLLQSPQPHREPEVLEASFLPANPEKEQKPSPVLRQVKEAVPQQ